MCKRSRILIGICLALLVATATAALPPISDPPTGEYRHGKFVWIDLVTADVAGARRFYGSLFGWSFADLGLGRNAYTLAYHAGAPVAGLAERQPAPNQQRQSRWIAYLSVPDVARAAAGATERGGRVLIPRRAVEGRGDMAVLADPDGAPFGLINSSTGDPPDFLAETGEWIWALYQSADAPGAAAFYQDIGGYIVEPDDRFGDRPHFMLVAEEFARASVVEIPAERVDLRPDWLYFVRVSDVVASLARAVELGGRVIVDRNPAVFDGRIAVIADPGGALLGLMEWEPAETEEQ